MNTNTIKDYTVQVRWDPKGQYFVADIPDVPTCSADGATPAEAIANLEETFAVLKEAYTEEQMAMPGPLPDLPITIDDLAHMSEVVNVAKIARKAGLSPQTLASKLKRGTEFKEVESKKIASTLASAGIHVGHFVVNGQTITYGTVKHAPGGHVVLSSSGLRHGLTGGSIVHAANAPGPKVGLYKLRKGAGKAGS